MPQRELNSCTSTHVPASDERPRPHCQWCCAPTTWNSCRLVHVSSENNVRTSAKWGEIERDAVIHFLLKNFESHFISFDAVTGSVTTRQRSSVLWQQKLRILFDMMQSKHSGGWMKKRIFKDNFALLFFSVCQGFWNRHSRSSGERWQDICHFPSHTTIVESTSPSANREFKLWKEKTSKEKWINLCKDKFAAGVGTFFPVVAFFLPFFLLYLCSPRHSRASNCFYFSAVCDVEVENVFILLEMFYYEMELSEEMFAFTNEHALSAQAPVRLKNILLHYIPPLSVRSVKYEKN